MKRLLVSLICICLCVGLASAQKIYLVCVGVADYPGTKYDLRLPVKDAETIQWVYQKNKRAETVLLTNSQATRENVLNTMKKSFSKASANDIIVLFSVDMAMVRALWAMTVQSPMVMFAK